MIHFNQKLTSKKAKTFIAAVNFFLIGGFLTFHGFNTVKATGTAPSYAPQSTYLSPVKNSAIPFTGLGVAWHEVEPSGTSAELLVRFFTKDGWSAWQSLHGDIDGKEEHDPEYPNAFTSTNEATAFQYKVTLTSQDVTVTPLMENIEFTYIHAREKVSVQSEDMIATIGPLDEKLVAKRLQNKATGIKIISRSQWGADESLRLSPEDDKDRLPATLVALEPDFEKKYANELKLVKKVTQDSSGQDLYWPLEYPKKVSKIIIHHTATTKNLNNPKQAIRDIYYWHTVTKGWGDIGYNYIIDQQGNIYEGRYGGDGVVGAHAGRANVGSIGIAVLGNYQEKDVPEPVMQSLGALIKEKTGKYSIDPTSSSSFRGEILPNIVGHRDVGSTSCPGEKLYSQLPALRAQIKGNFKPTVVDRRRPDENKKDYDYALDKEIPMIELGPGETGHVKITLKNTGNKSWGSSSSLVVSKTETATQFLNFEGLLKSAAAGKEIKPGGSATFTINLPAKFNGGFTTIEVAPLVNGKTKIEKYLSIPLQIESAHYDYELVKLQIAKSKLKPGESTEATLALKNTGNVTWKRTGSNRLMIGTESPRDHYSDFLAKPDTRLASLQENEIKPGETGHFKMKLTAPDTAGLHREYFAPVMEGITWLPFKENHLELNVYDNSPKKANKKTVSSDKIRVGLGFKGNPVISATGDFKLLNGTKEMTQFLRNEKVSVTYENGKYHIKGNKTAFVIDKAPRFESLNSAILRIDNYENRPEWKPELNDNEFRGALEVHFYQNQLHVVNELPVEDYLKGLAEISATEPVEKIRTIIILARSYAYYYTTIGEKFPGAPFDLCDDPARCQKYLGYGFEKRNPTGVKAVNDTKDIVVTYKGKIIKTPYSSSSDGKTRSAEAVWGWKDTPYLASVDDPGCTGKDLNGHGVGLSGCGALYFAQQGQNYEQIIKYFFKGVEVLHRGQLKP